MMYHISARNIELKIIMIINQDKFVAQAHDD